MRPILNQLPNLLSLLRLALVPALWPLAVAGDARTVGLGLLLAGLTDVVDGRVARRLGVSSSAGAALDSLADNLLAPSAAVWFVILRPDLAARFAIPLVAWAVLYTAFLVLGLVRFRRFGNLHLHSARAAGVVTYTFVIWALLAPGVPIALAWLAIGASLLAVIEGLLCQMLAGELDENVGSVVNVLRRRSVATAADRPWAALLVLALLAVGG